MTHFFPEILKNTNKKGENFENLVPLHFDPPNWGVGVDKGTLLHVKDFMPNGFVLFYIYIYFFAPSSTECLYP